MPSNSRKRHQKDNNMVICDQETNTAEAGLDAAAAVVEGKAAWSPSPETDCDQN